MFWANICLFAVFAHAALADVLTKDLTIGFSSDNDLSDNFNTELGKNNGWGNHELETYTVDAAKVEDGNLYISTTLDNGVYASARLKSKFSIRYGTLEARMKLPRGRGIWPAFWLLADNQPVAWPDNGEMDIMEMVGFDQDKIHGTIHCRDHYGANGAGGTTWVNGASDDYHTYKVDWSPTRITFSADDNSYFTYSKPSDATYNNWPFDNSFNIILNTAVGGDWGGAKGVDNSIFPQQYAIDYIKYTTSYSINTVKWTEDKDTDCKWAMGCDWNGMDLANVKVEGEQCAQKCAATSGCTHFTWTNWQGGICWMKSGQSADFMKTLNQNANGGYVCGYMNNS